VAGRRFFAERYNYSTEYVQVMKELWETGRSDFKGRYFQMDDCRLLPKPAGAVEIVCAGQSDRGMQFTAEYGNYAFCMGSGSTRRPPMRRSTSGWRRRGRRRTRRRDLCPDDGDRRRDRCGGDGEMDPLQGRMDVKALAWMADQAGADATASEHRRPGR